MTRFILLTMPRSGSTWLGTLLDDHPDIAMYGELFLDHDVPEKYKELRRHDPEKFFLYRKKSSSRRPKVTRIYLDKVFSGDKKTIGFKLMAYPLLRHPEIIFYCKKHDIRLVYLTRNIRDRVISYAVAEQRDHFHKLSEQSDLKEKITLDQKRVMTLYKRQKALSNILDFIIKKLPVQVMHLDYDDLAGHQDKIMGDLYHYLGVSPHQPDSHIQKTLSRPYEDIITNFSEIDKIFKQ